jgi:hypothetical protein
MAYTFKTASVMVIATVLAGWATAAQRQFPKTSRLHPD